MELTEKELRERGIRRAPQEIEEEARRFASEILLVLPTGRWVNEPAEGFSPEEEAFLKRGGLDLAPAGADEPDPLSRTAAKYAAIIAAALTTKEAANLLGVSEGRVRQRLQNRTLYGMKSGRENRLPVFQFDGDHEVRGVGEVLKHVDRTVHPVALLNWFTSPNPDLQLYEDEHGGASPREWLLSGGSPAVLVPLAEVL